MGAAGLPLHVLEAPLQPPETPTLCLKIQEGRAEPSRTPLCPCTSSLKLRKDVKGQSAMIGETKEGSFPSYFLLNLSLGILFFAAVNDAFSSIF